MLIGWMGVQAFIWNAKLNERRMWRSLSWHDARQYPDDRDWPEQDGAYSWIADSPETAWLNDIPSQIKRNAAAKFCTAVTHKLRGLAKEPRPKAAGFKMSVWIKVARVAGCQEKACPASARLTVIDGDCVALDLYVAAAKD